MAKKGVAGKTPVATSNGKAAKKSVAGKTHVATSNGKAAKKTKVVDE